MFPLWLRQWALPTLLLSALVLAALGFSACRLAWQQEQALTNRWLKAAAATLMHRMEQVRQDTDFLRQKTQILDAIPELSTRWQSLSDRQAAAISSKFRESRLAPVEFRDVWNRLEGIQDWTEAKGYADVLLLDADGLVLYSATGDIALGTSINTGKARHTVLNTAFREARRGRLYFSDVQPYPGHGQAVTTLFFSTLLEDSRGRPLGVLVLRLFPEALLEALQPATRMLPALRLYGGDGSIHLEHVPPGMVQPVWPETALIITRALAEGQGALQRRSSLPEEPFSPMLHFQLLEVMDARWVLAAQDGREIHWPTYAVPVLIAWLLLNGLLIFWLWKLTRPWNELLKKVEALPHLSALPELPFQYLPDARGRFTRVFLRLKEMAIEGRGVTGEVKHLEERLKQVEEDEDLLSDSVRHLTEQMHGLEDLVAESIHAHDEAEAEEQAAQEESTGDDGDRAEETAVANDTAETMAEANDGQAVPAPAPAYAATVVPLSVGGPVEISVMDEELLQELRDQCLSMRQHLQKLHRGLLSVAKRQRTVAELKPERLQDMADRISAQWLELLQGGSYSTAPEALKDMAGHAARLADAIRKAEGMVRQARLLSINAALEAGNLKGGASFNELTSEIKTLTGNATDTLKGLRESAATLKETAESLPVLWQGQAEIAASAPAVEELRQRTAEQMQVLAVAPSSDAEEEAAIWLQLTQQTAEIAMNLQALERRLKAMDTQPTVSPRLASGE